MAHVSKKRQRRPLGGFEHFMWRAHRMGCGLIWMIADVPTGPTSSTSAGSRHPLEGEDAPELLRQAALLCVRRHPNLRARIGSDPADADGSPYMEALPFEAFIAQYPVRVALVTDRPAVQFTEELLLSTPIPHAAAPLWQLALVRHAGAPPQLVALAHHSVLDGESLVLFLREVVANANALRRRFPDSPAAIEALLAGEGQAPLPFLPAQDELYATLLAGEDGDGWWDRVQFLRKRLSWLVQRPTNPTPELITTDTSQRRNRIYSTQVGGREFERLLRRCKAEGTTVTAAMAAAVMLEIKALMPDPPTAALKIETMVNLRKKLASKDPRLAESLHLFAAPVDMVVSVGEGPGGSKGQPQQPQPDGLWRRARAFKRDLTEAMARGQWRHQVVAFTSFSRGHGLVYRVLERLAVGPTQGRVKAAAVSNLGSLDATLGQQGAAAATIARLQWGITEHGIGQWIFVAVSSQRGALNLTLTCVDPIVSPARARGLLAGIVRRLLEEADAAGKGGVDPVGRLGAPIKESA